jgi:hypothetical protein
MKRYFLAVVILTFLLFIPNFSFAISMDDPELIAREAAQIERFKDKIKREGDTLLLKNKSGTYISFKDNLKCEGPDACAGFKFLDYFEDVGFFLVQGYFWETGQHIMISENDGRKYYVHELPMFSPDRRRLVTVPDDSDTGLGMNGVFIWRVEGDNLIPEYSYEPMEYAQYRFVRWKDNKFIELKKWLRSSKELCPETDFMVIPISLEMEDDGWKLYKYLSPDSVECDAN